MSNDAILHWTRSTRGSCVIGTNPSVELVHVCVWVWVYPENEHSLFVVLITYVQTHTQAHKDTPHTSFGDKNTVYLNNTESLSFYLSAKKQDHTHT